MKQIKRCFSTLIFSVFILGIICLYYNPAIVSAYEEYEIDRIELYNQTNTFQYNKKKNTQNMMDYYDMNSRLSNAKVSKDAPLMTVLMHGLGGQASHWSNSGSDDFTYDEYSIITQLQKATAANVYWLKIRPNLISFSLTYLNDQTQKIINGEKAAYEEKNDKITDISKPIIIVFEAYQTESLPLAPKDRYPGYYNDIIYEQFNFGISRMVYDIQYLSGGVLPRMNLIGHSKGGITNMQYALDHPELVASVFSLGTPYFGTTTGGMIKLLLEKIGKGYELELLNEQVYLTYQNRWNDNYERLYKDIEVHAIGGYSTLLYIMQCLETEISKNGMINFLKGMGIDWITADKVIPLIQALLGVLNGAELYSKFSPSLSPIVNVVPIVAQLTQFLGIDTVGIAELITILTAEMRLDIEPMFIAWENDVLVDLSSQLGKRQNTGGLLGYKGFHVKAKKFTLNNSNPNRVSASTMPVVVHNLEPRDIELISYIMSRINMEGKKTVSYLTYTVSDTEVGIYSYVGITNSSSLEIPSEIEGKRVVEIGACAFSSNFNGNDVIKTVIIPNAITKIHNSAFSNCDFLTEVKFLESIEELSISNSAFSECKNLNKIVLPNRLIALGSQVFQGCESLTTINIPNSVVYIGDGAFLDSNIVNIEMQDNYNYIYEHDTLYDYAKTEILYSRASNQFVVPNSVKEIKEYAFYNNKNLVSIDLANVINIREYAFTKCDYLSIVTGGNNVERVNKISFFGTEWLNNAKESKLILGKVLLHYGEEELEYDIPNEIIYIGQSAFESNTLTKVYIRENVSVISIGAFLSCEQLQEVYLFRMIPPIIYSNSFYKHDYLKIYVPEVSKQEYQSNGSFELYRDFVEIKKIDAYLYKEDGNFLDMEEVNAYSVLESFPIVSKEGHKFTGWFNPETGKHYFNGRVFDIYQDSVQLYASFEINRFVVYLNYEDKYLNRDSVTYGELKQFDVPIKNGASFIGWFDASGKQYTGSDGFSLFGWDKDSEKTILFAKFLLETYQIEYNLNGGTNSDENPKSYTVQDIITLQTPIRYGYLFEGWYLNGTNVKIIELESTQDIVIEARWKGIVTNCSPTMNNVKVSNEISIILLDNLSVDKTIEIEIFSTTQQVTFINNTSKVYNMFISVNERNTPLHMNFKNVNFVAPNNHDGINAIEGDYLLSINFQGLNSIRGGNGVNSQDNRDSTVGRNGIAAKRLLLSGETIFVIGGNGGSGESGINGFAGANGEKGPRGSIGHPIDGDNGEHGKSGSNGKHGSHGGYAIYVQSTLIIEMDKFTLKGGNGGNGGSGGDGGQGGNGASDTNGNIFNGVGKPGNGGNGGSGGDGGNAGGGQFATNKDYYQGQSGTHGSAGKGGKGGQGGSIGSNGSDGQFGEYGISGIVTKVNYFVELNCETNNLQKTVVSYTRQTILFEMSVVCSGSYNIKFMVENDSTIYFYNSEMIELSNRITRLPSGATYDIDVFFQQGTYYMEITNFLNTIPGHNATVIFNSKINKTINLEPTIKIDILKQMHDYQSNFAFVVSNTGLFDLTVNTTKKGKSIYPDGEIVITEGQSRNSKIVKKYNGQGEAMDSNSIQDMAIFLETGKTYYVHIVLRSFSVETLLFGIQEVSELMLDANNKYYSERRVSDYDSFESTTIRQTGEYNFKIHYDGNNTRGNTFLIIRQKDKIFTQIVSVELNENNRTFDKSFFLSSGDKMYMGYFNGNGIGKINQEIHCINSLAKFKVNVEDYKYAEQYFLEEKQVSHSVSNQNFITNRLRTGYIQREYIVLSPRKVDAGIAYLEYNFESPIYRIEVDLALWSASELLRISDCTAVLQYKDKYGNWITQLDLLRDIDLTNDRSKPNRYTIEFGNPTYEFRFYTTAPKVGTSKNLGRLCIGEMEMYYHNDVSNHDHVHYKNVRHNDIWHKEYCECGEFIFHPHVVLEIWEYNNVFYGRCIDCGEIIRLNVTIKKQLRKRRKNSDEDIIILSYISNNGIIILHVEDIDSYLDGEILYGTES